MMGAYGWAWVVMVLVVLLGLYALHRATRDSAWRRTRSVLAALLVVWLLLPAPVPGFEQRYAPAFVVFSFEALFQQAGNPRPAAVILAAGTALVLAMVLLFGVARRGNPRPDDRE